MTARLVADRMKLMHVGAFYLPDSSYMQGAVATIVALVWCVG